MIPPIRARIDEFRQQRRVRANSLIVSLFGDMVVPRGGRIWLGSLIRLLEPLGLNERLVRTSVFRLGKAEWLCTKALGRRSDYLLTESGQRRFDEASRHIYAAYSPSWDGRWRLVLNVGQLAPADRDALRRALFWQGFGMLGGDCFVHPGADLALVFEALVADGLGHLLGGLMPLLAGDSAVGNTAGSTDLVARAWNLSELAKSYRLFVTTYTPILLALKRKHTAPVDDESAFLIRLLLIHDYRRLLLRDPELPDVLLPPGWPGQAARTLCKELYRLLLAPSEHHLDRCYTTADGNSPPFIASYYDRFSEVAA